MKPTGVNMTNVKQINRSYVLQLLLTKGAMSRTDLANELDLTTATLTSICSDFIQRGLIVQLDKADQHISGRKKCPLEINATYKYVVAISLHYNGHFIAITDLCGKLIAGEALEIEKGVDPETFFHSVAAASIRMLWEHHIPSEAVLGAGVCIIGPVDQDRGVALHPFKIFEETNVPVRDMLERELPFPVCVESNVCSFLTAETLLGDAAGNTLLAVKWGPGVGSASSIAGIISKDASYNSTEIGHTFYYQDSEQRCKCDRVGCLETGVCLARIIERIEQILPESQALCEVHAQYGAPSVHNIKHYLSADCTELRAFVDRLSRDLAVGVNNAVRVFPPDQIILFGVLFESDYAFQSFLAHFHELNPGVRDTLFVRSRLENKLEYIGPAAIAIKTFFLETGGEEFFNA